MIVKLYFTVEKDKKKVEEENKERDINRERAKKIKVKSEEKPQKEELNNEPGKDEDQDVNKQEDNNQSNE